MIGWDNLTLGRITGKMIDLQDWWIRGRPINVGRKDIDSKEALKKALVIVLLTRYELWKQRSVQVIEKEGPSKLRALKRQAEKFKDSQETVERRDASLFHPKSIPREGDGEQRHKDWIEAVIRSQK